MMQQGLGALVPQQPAGQAPENPVRMAAAMDVVTSDAEEQVLDPRTLALIKYKDAVAAMQAADQLMAASQPTPTPPTVAERTKLAAQQGIMGLASRLAPGLQQQGSRMAAAQAQQAMGGGLPQLPAPNMAGMASGGIVGYSGEDGSVVGRGGPNLFPSPADTARAVAFLAEKGIDATKFTAEQLAEVIQNIDTFPGKEGMSAYGTAERPSIRELTAKGLASLNDIGRFDGTNYSPTIDAFMRGGERASDAVSGLYETAKDFASRAKPALDVAMVPGQEIGRVLADLKLKFDTDEAKRKDAGRYKLPETDPELAALLAEQQGRIDATPVSMSTEEVKPPQPSSTVGVAPRMPGGVEQAQTAASATPTNSARAALQARVAGQQGPDLNVGIAAPSATPNAAREELLALSKGRSAEGTGARYRELTALEDMIEQRRAEQERLRALREEQFSPEKERSRLLRAALAGGADGGLGGFGRGYTAEEGRITSEKQALQQQVIADMDKTISELRALGVGQFEAEQTAAQIHSTELRTLAELEMEERGFDLEERNIELQSEQARVNAENNRYTQVMNLVQNYQGMSEAQQQKLGSQVLAATKGLSDQLQNVNTALALGDLSSDEQEEYELLKNNLEQQIASTVETVTVQYGAGTDYTPIVEALLQSVMPTGMGAGASSAGGLTSDDDALVNAYLGN